MSKCPFWSNKREKVGCYNECPMNPVNNNEDTCPFTEHLSLNKAMFKDIIDDDFAYSQDNKLDYLVNSYCEY